MKHNGPFNHSRWLSFLTFILLFTAVEQGPNALCHPDTHYVTYQEWIRVDSFSRPAGPLQLDAHPQELAARPTTFIAQESEVSFPTAIAIPTFVFTHLRTKSALISWIHARSHPYHS